MIVPEIARVAEGRRRQRRREIRMTIGTESRAEVSEIDLTSAMFEMTSRAGRVLELRHHELRGRVTPDVVMAGHAVLVLDGPEEPRVTALTIVFDIGVAAAHVTGAPRLLLRLPEQGE